MKTIFETLNERAEKGSFIELTTVWNVHNVSFESLLSNKNSNLRKLIDDESWISRKHLDNGITLVIGAKGRSQHSSSELLIFKGDQTESLGCKSRFFTQSELECLGVTL